MRPHTVLRFGGKGGASKIAVELGAIELSGTGSYGLDVGDVNLEKARVRITAKGKGDSTIELLVGEARVSSLRGQMIDLVIGEPIELSLGDVVVTSIDAGVMDAAPPIDAPDVVIPGGSDDRRGWKAGRDAAARLDRVDAATAGRGRPRPGSTVRLGTGTTAKLTANSTSVEMAGGARVSLGDDRVFLSSSAWPVHRYRRTSSAGSMCPAVPS